MPESLRTVFVSYSHVPTDLPWKRRLVEHIRVIASQKQFEVWDDEQIRAGEVWKNEIERAIDGACVALLLISSSYLTSTFIQQNEIPRLLERNAQRTITLMPIIARACAWEHVDWLAAIELPLKQTQPLDSIPERNVDSHMAELARVVSERVSTYQLVPLATPVSANQGTTSLPVAGPGHRHCSAVRPNDGRDAVTFETVTVDDAGIIVRRRKCSVSVFVEDLGAGAILELAAIPGGTFWMGSPMDEADRDANEGPQVTIEVAPFWVGRFAVTQAQWRAVIESVPRVEHELPLDPAYFKGAHRPVEQVSWLDAAEFCRRLSRHSGRNYRLPSEAEWEYAARAGTNSAFAFGPTITPELANYDGARPYSRACRGAYRRQTSHVSAVSQPNAWGLFDVHGNVWEWVRDQWHHDYKDMPSDGRAWEKGKGPTKRVLRGGAWNCSAARCRSAVRSSYAPNGKLRTFGLRVVCDGASPHAPPAR